MKTYKCGYRHCVKPDEKVLETEAVRVGRRYYHPECSKMADKIDVIKKIYFDYIDDKSNYVEVVGVINNLIFKKQYDVDFVEFLMKYTVVYGGKIKSPYILHVIAKNGIVDKKYNDEKLRMDVIRRFDNRCRKS